MRKRSGAPTSSLTSSWRKRNLHHDENIVDFLPGSSRERKRTKSKDQVTLLAGAIVNTYQFKDDKGDEWIMNEVVTNNTGGVHFRVKINGRLLIGYHGSQDHASFSLSTTRCQGQIVHLDRFQLPEHNRYKGYGPRILKEILKIYDHAGCSLMDVPAPNQQGTNCYKKCGFARNGKLNLMVMFNSPEWKTWLQESSTWKHSSKEKAQSEPQQSNAARSKMSLQGNKPKKISNNKLDTQEMLKPSLLCKDLNGNTANPNIPSGSSKANAITLEDSNSDLDNAVQTVKKSRNRQLLELSTQHGHVHIHDSDLSILNGEDYLNDEIMNYYLHHLFRDGSFENYHCFSTFFFEKFRQGKLDDLGRWTKGVDVFQKDFVFIR